MRKPKNYFTSVVQIHKEKDKQGEERLMDAFDDSWKARRFPDVPERVGMSGPTAGATTSESRGE